MNKQESSLKSFVWKGNKLYGVCGDCGEIIQINKWLIGSMHICTTEEEKRIYACLIAQKRMYNLRILNS